MSRAEFVFLVALICSVAGSIYMEQARALSSSYSYWMRLAAVNLVIAWNVLFATCAVWVANHFQ